MSGTNERSTVPGLASAALCAPGSPAMTTAGRASAGTCGTRSTRAGFARHVCISGRQRHACRVTGGRLTRSGMSTDRCSFAQLSASEPFRPPTCGRGIQGRASSKGVLAFRTEMTRRGSLTFQNPCTRETKPGSSPGSVMSQFLSAACCMTSSLLVARSASAASRMQ